MTGEEIKKGLMNVIVDSTTISKVNPDKKMLYYRGYPVPELTKYCVFEEVAYLLMQGSLPNRTELEGFKKQEVSKRELSDSVVSLIQSLPTYSHPMDNLRTVISFIGCENQGETNPEKALNLLAKIPAIIAFDFRRKKGKSLILPDPNLSIAANFFYMCFGVVPDEAIVKAFDVSLILYAEHSFNASTFTARVITSSLCGLYGAVTGAISSLKGPLHGGANEAVMHMFEEIGEVSQAKAWLLGKLERKEKVMGFGHRVYRKGDSRVPTMKSCLETVSTLKGNTTLLEMYKVLEGVMVNEKNIFPNLDFPAGPTYHLMGFETAMFTPIFVMSRIAGWSAHIMEQSENNKLIRPLSAYHGEIYSRVLPLDER